MNRLSDDHYLTLNQSLPRSHLFVTEALIMQNSTVSARLLAELTLRQNLKEFASGDLTSGSLADKSKSATMKLLIKLNLCQ